MATYWLTLSLDDGGTVAWHTTETAAIARGEYWIRMFGARGYRIVDVRRPAGWLREG